MCSLRSATVRTAVVVVLLGVISCGGPRQKPTYPTDGKLLISGQPVGNVTVFLNPLNSPDPELTRAYATTKSDGTFSLTTYAAYDGAPEGEYVVTILYEPLDSPLFRAKGKPPTFDKKFTDPATSPLRATIVKQPRNQLDPFDVK
ncbi:MAG: hypothetical protein JWO38_7420 [Gemmataceae bacterium]|nr:hypothetical protein [Gemmataceae bacterium]